MMKMRKRLAAAVLASALALAGIAAPAQADHKFSPPNKSNACQGPNDQPNCPSWR
jgi:uncharacterized membrane protein